MWVLIPLPFGEMSCGVDSLQAEHIWTLVLDARHSFQRLDLSCQPGHSLSVQIPVKAVEMLNGGLREILESPCTIKVVAEGRQVRTAAVTLCLPVCILCSADSERVSVCIGDLMHAFVG